MVLTIDKQTCQIGSGLPEFLAPCSGHGIHSFILLLLQSESWVVCLQNNFSELAGCKIVAMETNICVVEINFTQ